ncbi:DNA-deoxyinosine glycosylase [Salipaludibacillus aurantiacus]|uniref:TDG/mug DNA glycosylase family protein n=1 Tax=Salipaludibacillus aurantiacus TaxID=1601833 RepID=A0A1H9VS77_9BACI|nr:DNA-deoxyinosine glycosylase [Salipaludibacillus aurantiacus]SES24389.1 TDG/mug DNA glycosylase family protein [Salipaludibacillus aurantiacus]
MKERHSLEPVVQKGARVLILGSMPGEQSLQRREYYGNPRNHFWPLVGELLNTDLSTFSYERKCDFLKTNHIALWDVIGSCKRKGSLDSAIRDEKMNDLAGLLTTYPTIQWVGLNGTKAYETFRKYIKNHAFPPVPYTKLPSTSPVPGRNVKSFSEKVKAWREMTDYLQHNGGEKR